MIVTPADGSAVRDPDGQIITGKPSGVSPPLDSEPKTSQGLPSDLDSAVCVSSPLFPTPSCWPQGRQEMLEAISYRRGALHPHTMRASFSSYQELDVYMCQ